MGQLLKQSTAANILVLMIDTSDHISGKTGLTLTIKAHKAGGAESTITPTVTERTNGLYQLALTTSHTDTLGQLVLHITATGADPTTVEHQVIAADLGDTVRLGLTALPNAAAEAAGGLYTRGSGAGQINQPANGLIDANVTRFGGTAGTFASGRPEVSLGNVAHGGAAATLSLKTATIDAGSGGGDALTIAGGAASGATPAGHAIKATGGASSTTGGGTAGDGFRATGGAASTATNVGGHGINATGGAGSEEQTGGHGLLATGGVAGSTNAGGTAGDGAKVVGGAATTANAAGHGLEAVGGAAANNAAGTGGDGFKASGASASGSGAAGVDIRGNQTGNITGNLSGSVGSVTGAVGSVTGNVGGNVVGSVASVSGNVGGNVVGSIGSLAAQAKADVNAEVDSALDTAIPGSPTSDSINERIKTLDDNFTATVAGRIDAAVSSRLAPTTAGRTLDVSAGGEAGLDWANIGSPTTAVNLSGTTVKTATDVETDTQDIQSRLPAALVSGRIDASVGAVAANAITAAAIADGAIDAATFAADSALAPVRTGTAQAGAAGSITLDASASSVDDFYKDAWVRITGSTGAGQARLITAYNGTSKVATIAPNWATNPSGTSTFAVLTAAQIGGVQGSVTGSVASVSGAVGSVTGNVGGNVTGNVVGSIGSLAAQAKADVNAEADTALSDVGVTTTVTGRIDAAISTRLASASISLSGGAVTVGTNNDKTGYRLSATGVDDVWDEATSGHTTAGTTGKALTDADNGAPPTAAAIADQVWEEAIADHSGTAGSTAEALENAGAAGTPPSAADIADAVWDETLADHLTAGSTGAGLNAAGSAGDPWATALPGAYGAGTAGKIVGDNLNATVSSRLAASAITLASGKVTVGTNDDKTGYALTSGYDPAKTAAQAGDAMALTSGERTTLVAAIWDKATSALTTVGSIGKLLVDNINATIASRSSHTAADVWAVGTRTLTSFGTLVADIWSSATRVLTAGTNIVLAKGTGVTGFNDLDAAGVRSAVGLASANLDTQLDALPTAAENATAVAAQVTTDHGSGSYVRNTEPLDAAGTRTAIGLASANLDTQLDALPTAVENADAFLDRDMSIGTDSGSDTVRTPRQALRVLRNKVSVTAGKVYKEDDATEDWGFSVTTDPDAEPLVSVDPTGP